MTLPANPQISAIPDALRDRADKAGVLAAMQAMKQRGIGVTFEEAAGAIDAYLAAGNTG